MDIQVAEQIAILLNTQNQLTVKYDTQQILEAAHEYIYEIDDDDVLIACMQLKSVQWYQVEICHVSVNKINHQYGAAYRLLDKAIIDSREKNVHLLQATVNQSNGVPQKFLQKFNFTQTSTFYNPLTKNHITVWQKALSKRHFFYSNPKRKVHSNIYLNQE